jgi:hypothetical protein
MLEKEPHSKDVSDADLHRIWGGIVLKPEVKAELLDMIRPRLACPTPPSGYRSSSSKWKS